MGHNEGRGRCDNDERGTLHIPVPMQAVFLRFVH